LYTVAAGKATQLSRHNDPLIAQRPWQPAQPISFNSADGTEIHGLLIRPEGAKKGRRYPTVLWIHGGPASQFGYEPRLEPQLFAAHGYAVVLVNPRGSTGRGLAFSKEIWRGWGSVDVPDVLAGIDHVVAMGVADSKRLVVGGWSYGGMLTNYVIASDQPLLATEQMYQALKVLRVPTQMVIYPGQSHGLRVPSYQADRWQRYLAWFAKYL
jgi:dipeptidyl aminopeptidase/acylaminoacyl peptidase